VKIVCSFCWSRLLAGLFFLLRDEQKDGAEREYLLVFLTRDSPRQVPSAGSTDRQPLAGSALAAG
jgi:hypothetical protein